MIRNTGALAARAWSPGADRTTDAQDRLVLGAILLGALALRLVGLNWPLWYDEIVTLETHLRLPWSEMMRSYSMNHHYLHNLQARLAIDAFGDDPWAVRLPALIFGLASIAAFWWLAREVAGRWVAHLTAALLALSYHHIWFSQNARGYTELAFWSALGMILFLRGLGEPRRGLWIGFGVTLAAAVFTHLTGAFFFAAQGLVWLGLLAARAAAGRRDRALVLRPLLGFALGAALALVLYGPIVPDVIETVGAVSETSSVDRMQEYQSPLWTVIEGIRTALGAAGPAALAVGAAVLALAVLGGVVTHSAAPAFAVTVLAHILVTLAVLLALDMRIWPRFFFVDIGFVLILVVAGVGRACELIAAWLRRPAAAGRLFALAAAAMLAVSAVSAAGNWRAPKQDLAGAYALVEGMRTASDRVVAIGYPGEAFRSHFGADWEVVFEDAAYRAALAAPGRVYVVVAFPGRAFRAVPSLARDRQEGLEELARLPGTLGDGAVYVFRRG